MGESVADYKKQLSIRCVDFQNSKILIIDDEDFSRTFLNKIFRNNGFTNIELAQDGEEGLKKMEEFVPSLVILDLMMPNLDGFEFCKRVRENPKFRDIPILVQSAANRPEEVKKAFHCGATDFVGKPIQQDEVIARTKVHLENQDLLNDFKIYGERVKRELDSAKQMQEGLMPPETEIKEMKFQYKLDIGTYFETCSELGGDFWGFRPVSHNELAVYTVDFSGHGVTAALNTFRIHTILQEQNNFALSPETFLSVLNKRLLDLLDTGQFATMFYGVIDIEKNIMRFSAAGSPMPIVISKKGEVTLLDSSGVPLGISSSANYDFKQMDFYPGDIVALYSDALTETENLEGKFITETELINLLSLNKSIESTEIINKFLEKLHAHSNSPLNDDLTINIYKRLG